MVATDIASRGLDIAGVSHVINYDVPEHPEDYVHRIGRTGRAQNVGDAFTLMNGQEVSALQAIEHFIGQKIPRLKLENFPYLYTALFEPESGAIWQAGHYRPKNSSRIFIRAKAMMISRRMANDQPRPPLALEGLDRRKS